MVNSFDAGRMTLDAIKTAAAHLPAQSVSQLPSVFDQGNYALTGHASTLQTSMEATAYQWTGPAANAATTAVLNTSTQGVMSADASQVASSMTSDFMSKLYETQNAVAAIQPVDTSQAAAIRKAGGPAVIALIPSAAVAAQHALSAEAKARQQQAAKLMNNLNAAASDYAEVQPTIFPVIPVPNGFYQRPPVRRHAHLAAVARQRQWQRCGREQPGRQFARWCRRLRRVGRRRRPALGTGPVTAQEALTLSPLPPRSTDNTVAAVGPPLSGGLSTSAGAVAGTTAVTLGLLGGGAITGVGQDAVAHLTGGRISAAPGTVGGGTDTLPRSPSNAPSSGNDSGLNDGRLSNPAGSAPSSTTTEEPVATAGPAANAIDDEPRSAAGGSVAEERPGTLGAPNVGSAEEAELNRRYPVAGLDGELTTSPKAVAGPRTDGGSATEETVGNRLGSPGPMNDEGELRRVGPNGLPIAESTSSLGRGLGGRYSVGDSAWQAETRPNSLSTPSRDLHAGQPMAGRGSHRDDDDDELRPAPAYLKEPDDFWGDGRLAAPQVIDWNYEIDDAEEN